MHPTSIYIIVATAPDGETTIQARCFASELAARCDAEALGEGKLDWISRTYGRDEAETEFKVRKLTMWRYGTGQAP